MLRLDRGRILLEAQKIATRRIISQHEMTRMANVELETRIDLVTQDLWVDLVAFIYGIRGEKRTRQVRWSGPVRGTVENAPEQEARRGILAFALAGTAIAVFGALNAWFLLLLVPFVALGLREAFRPSLPLAYEQTVHGTVRVPVEEFVAFPEHQVPPPQLGKPVPIELFEDGEFIQETE